MVNNCHVQTFGPTNAVMAAFQAFKNPPPGYDALVAMRLTHMLAHEPKSTPRNCEQMDFAREAREAMALRPLSHHCDDRIELEPPPWRSSPYLPACARFPFLEPGQGSNSTVRHGQAIEGGIAA